MAALSQLSYSPSEVVLRSKVNTCELVVARRRQPELNRMPVRKELRWKQESAIRGFAIGGKQLDLMHSVR